MIYFELYWMISLYRKQRITTYRRCCIFQNFSISRENWYKHGRLRSQHNISRALRDKNGYKKATTLAHEMRVGERFCPRLSFLCRASIYGGEARWPGRTRPPGSFAFCSHLGTSGGILVERCHLNLFWQMSCILVILVLIILLTLSSFWGDLSFGS